MLEQMLGAWGHWQTQTVVISTHVLLSFRISIPVTQTEPHCRPGTALPRLLGSSVVM